MKTPRMTAVALVTLFLSLPLFAAVTFSENQWQAFGGEKCVQCHSTKPAIQPQAPGESFEVVIVGGGMAGLSTLHYLQDVNAVLLETQERVGGQMLYNTWQGIRYAEGAAYFVEPYGILADFYRTERIPLIKIPEPENSAWIRGKFYPNCWTAQGRARMPWSRRDMRNYVQFCTELEEVNSLSLSCQPFEFFSDDQQQLDRLPAMLWMQQKGLNDEMIDLFDRYIQSCFGVGASMISASGFANYLSGEIGGNLTVPGGLGAVAELIYQNHKDRVRLHCHVLRIEQDLREARVIYLDPQGRQQTMRAKAVVAAVPCNLLPELIPDLPKEKRQVIAKTRYAAYMVAAVLCREVLWEYEGYDTWVLGTFFRDIIDADWIQRQGKPHANKKQPHVLSLYIPLGIEGRDQMVDAKPEEYKQKILTDLEKVIPGCSAKIEDMRLNRFGHSMHVAGPGFMSRSMPILRKPFFRIHFAGAEVEGLPCNESAILSGYKAATSVRTWLWPELPNDKRAAPEAREKVQSQ
jgi:monoamine oxidase